MSTPVSASTIRTHLDYTAWASARLIEAARELSAEELTRDLTTSHQSLLGTLIHTFAADRVWLDRIHGRSRTTLLNPGEDETLAMLEREWPILHGMWKEWAAGLDDAAVEKVISFKMMSGAPAESALWQVVLHVVNHGSVHRGQVVTMLRQLGRKPPGTDLITFYRLSVS